MMGMLLFALAALFAAAFCSEEYKTFCHGRTCPHYEVVDDKHQEFEERKYVETRWLSTKIADRNSAVAAYNTLRDFCNNNGAAGKNISETWPALIVVTETSEYFMEWFIPPGTSVSPTDKVSVRERPAGTVYVRVFGGRPFLENGENNARILREDLEDADISYDRQEFIGAGYDPLIAIVFHNEIWIRAKQP